MAVGGGEQQPWAVGHSSSRTRVARSSPVWAKGARGRSPPSPAPTQGDPSPVGRSERAWGAWAPPPQFGFRPTRGSGPALRSGTRTPGGGGRLAALGASPGGQLTASGDKRG